MTTVYNHNTTEAEMLETQNTYIAALPTQYQAIGHACARQCAQTIARYGTTELHRKAAYKVFYEMVNIEINIANRDPGEKIWGQPSSGPGQL